MEYFAELFEYNGLYKKQSFFFSKRILISSCFEYTSLKIFIMRKRWNIKIWIFYNFRKKNIKNSFQHSNHIDGLLYE